MDFINDTLNPELFERIDTAFPSMGFQRNGRGDWYSPFKLNGERAKNGAKDKTVILKQCPYCVIEHGEKPKSLFNFYKELNGKDFKEALRELCSICGLPVPKGYEHNEANDRKDEALEGFAMEMSEALYSDEASAVLKYLKEVRGYSDEFIKYAGFGYISTDTAQRLSPLFGYTNKDGNEVNSLSGLIWYEKYKRGYIGNSHCLAIPYRTGGHIKGFVFRRTDGKEGTEGKKYLDAFTSYNATKKYNLFGLTGLRLTGNTDKDKDLLFVEGEIDALRASFSGVRNVVGISGGEVYKDALQEAKRRGVERVTLLLDTEDTETEQENNFNKAERAVRTIQEEGLSAFVCYLPSDGGKVDADTYLRNHSGEELQAVVDDAREGCFFLFDRLCSKVRESEITGNVSDKEIDNLKRRTIELLNDKVVTSPTNRDFIIKECARFTNNGITAESLKEEADAQRTAEEIASRNNTLSLMGSDFLNKVKDGHGDEALSAFMEKARTLTAVDEEGHFDKLLTIEGTAEREKGYGERPQGIPMDFVFHNKDLEKERLTIPAGAITLFCALPSHGKSMVLQNFALRIAKKGEGSVLYFTYEEDRKGTELRLLNALIGKSLNRSQYHDNNVRILQDFFASGTTQYINSEAKEHFYTKRNEFNKLIEGGSLIVRDGNIAGQNETPLYSEDLSRFVRYASKRMKVKAVVIDYIQLLHKRAGNWNGKKKEELREICEDLKNLAKDTMIPIILGAQLNRPSELLPPEDVAPSNIADCTEIEHSANMIITLYNSASNTTEEIKKKTYIEKEGFQFGKAGMIYAKLVKNRQGKRGLESYWEVDPVSGYIKGNYNGTDEQKELPFGKDEDENLIAF